MARSRKKGFTMLEVMVAVGIAGILSMMAGTVYTANIHRAQRVEAVVNLENIHVGQFAYYAAHDAFAKDFEELDLNADGVVSGRVLQGKRYAYTMSQPWGSQSWFCSSAADLDGDPWQDVLVAYEKL